MSAKGKTGPRPRPRLAESSAAFLSQIWTDRLPDLAGRASYHQLAGKSLNELRNPLLRSLGTQLTTAKWFKTIWEQEKENREQPRPMPELDTHRVSGNDEVDQVLRVGLAMDSEGQIRAEWAISNQTVHHWLRSRRSRCVLINGNSTLERISPISFFCAMLIKGLNVIKPIHVLSYFCDINAGGQRMPRGKDLLKSLTSQLIAQWKSGPLNCLSQQEVEELHYTASRPSIRFLRSVFQRLVVTLPAGTPLFIIIDGIDYYETTHLSKDTKSVVKEITGLADKEEVKALVKLVITSANRALDVSKYFSDDEKVWVPETLSSGRVFKWISNDN